jgi:hypothetical protein
MPRALRDRDSAERVFRLKVIGWSLFPAASGAVVIGIYGSVHHGSHNAIYWAIGGFFAGFIIPTVVALAVSEFAGHAAGSIVFGSGSSTPARREYSLGESLAARGDFPGAVREFERCATTWPEDPEPRVRLARLYRDRLAGGDAAHDALEAAARWLRSAIAATGSDHGLEAQLVRELYELHVGRLDNGNAVLPDLARFADRRAGTPAAAWARDRMHELKRDIES